MLIYINIGCSHISVLSVLGAHIYQLYIHRLCKSLMSTGIFVMSALHTQMCHVSVMSACHAHMYLSMHRSCLYLVLTYICHVYTQCSHVSLISVLGAHMYLSYLYSVLTCICHVCTWCSHVSVMSVLGAHYVFIKWFLCNMRFCSHERQQCHTRQN